MIRVYIADDHQLFIEGISSMLDGHPAVKIIGSAANGDELIQLVENKAPDVVLLDVNMPGRDGIATCKHLQLISPRPHFGPEHVFRSEYYRQHG